MDVSRAPSAVRATWTAAPVHPILLGLLFPLYLLAENLDQWVDLSVALPPIALSVVAGGVLLVVCARLFGGWLRGGLVASLLVALFFTFGHVRLAIGASGIGVWILAATWLGLALVGLTLIGRGTRLVVPATQALNLMAVMLVSFNLLTVGAFLGAQASAGVGSIGTADASVQVGQVTRTPDVYYLVFDRYANAETLRELYDFDNEPFLAELEERGFVIARDSWANYGGTALSLGSSLNLDYLDTDVLGTTEPATYAPIHAQLRGHLAVPQTLTDLGYRYVHIGSWWEPGTTNVDADEVLLFRQETEYATALLETTAATLVAGLSLSDQGGPAGSVVVPGREHTLFGFEQVEAASSRSGPTYVFAHFLVPHPPYVFEADGSVPDPDEVAAHPRQAYVQQLRWTNERILDLLDGLLADSPDEQPVIVLQADEGPYPDRYEADQVGFAWLDATAAEVQEKFGILNAIHLPGLSLGDVRERGFDDRRSPVNTFRLIFNEYFDTDLPYLEDRTYLSPDKRHLYEFTLYPRSP